MLNGCYEILAAYTTNDPKLEKNYLNFFKVCVTFTMFGSIYFIGSWPMIAHKNFGGLSRKKTPIETPF